jgi:hypothetical protein
MTTITLDPQPDSPECFRIDATMAPRNAPPSDDRPRLASEWKRTADGRMTCTWTLRAATRARLPDLSPEDSASGLENCVRSIEDRIAIAGHDRFLVWIWQPPRRVRTILGMAAAVFFLGLATAYLSKSTAVVDPNFSSELPTVAPELGSGHRR